MPAFPLFSTTDWRIPVYLALTIMLISPKLTASEAGTEHRVLDPKYGYALYHYFQRNDLAAITQLMVDKERPQSSAQRDESNLLLGDLYYGYGLYEEADQLFAGLLDQDTLLSLRNRVWFNLARLHQEQGLYDRAQELLSQIEGRLSPEIDAERQYLLTNLHLHQQQYYFAKQASEQIDHESTWSLYARYNLAVTLLDNNQSNQSKAVLDEIGQMQAESSEKLALRDQANLALGLSYLRHGQPKMALARFSRIRLQSPLSHEALLGAGWAWSRLDQPTKALTPWLELVNLNTIDAATQEALLAVPTSLENFQQDKLAVQYYELAVTRLNEQLDVLDQVIEIIAQNELLGVLEQQVFVSDRASFERFPLESSTTPYLHILFASERFQHEVKRYQDLLDIRASLLHWNSNLPVLALMLKERRRHFNQKLPLLEQSSTFDNLEKLKESRDRLAAKMKAIEAKEDYLSLATAEEKQHLQRLGKVENSLTGLDGKKEIAAQSDMHRLLSGLLHWEIGTDYAPRLWQARKQLKELDLALDEAKFRVRSLGHEKQNSNNGFAEFERRIAGKQNQIGKFGQRVADLIRRQEKRINKLAFQAIRQQQQHIVQLRVNTRYALTSLLDRLVSN